MAIDTANMIAGLPNPAGGFYYGDTSTAVLPTDSKAALDESLTFLGDANDDGLTETPSRDTTNVPDWAGRTVKVLQTSYTKTYKITLIEALREDVQKLVNGDANVTATAATTGHGNQLAVVDKGQMLPNKVFVADMIDPSGAAFRQVIPNGQVTDIGDITWAASGVVGYEVTITAYPDAAGNFSYLYTDDGQVTAA